jgi:hypothetical protein
MDMDMGVHALITRTFSAALLPLFRLVCAFLLFLLPPSGPLACRMHRAWHLASVRPRWRTAGAAPTDPPAECSAHRRRLLIVGCGLSGVQLASEARRRGWRHVTLLSRGPLAVRPFDIPDEWVQRHFSCALLPCETAFFGGDTYGERRAILARARPGGSISRLPLTTSSRGQPPRPLRKWTCMRPPSSRAPSGALGAKSSWYY